MEQLKTCIVTLPCSAPEQVPDLQERIYYLLGCLEIVDEKDSVFFKNEILPNIYWLFSKKLLKKDLIYLSLIGNQNNVILERFLIFDKFQLSLDLREPNTLYSYLIYEKKHWFYEVIENPSLLNGTECFDAKNKARLIKLLKESNADEVNVDSIDNLLTDLDLHGLDDFWKHHVNHVKHAVNIVKSCRYFWENINESEAFKFAEKQNILKVFFTYVNIWDENNWRKIISEIQNFEGAQEEFETFTAFVIIVYIFNLVMRSPGKKETKNSFIRETVDTIRTKILQIDDRSLQMEILENIFVLIFIKYEQLQECTEGYNLFVCTEKEIRLVLFLLKSVIDDPKLMSSYKPSLPQYGRFLRLKKSISDALWRLDLLENVKDMEKISKNLLKYMLAPPQALIQMCLKVGDLKRAYQVIEIFNLQDTDIAVDILNTNSLIEFKDSIRRSGSVTNKSLETFFKTFPIKRRSEELIIEEFSPENKFLDQYKLANELFLNKLDFAITHSGNKLEGSNLFELSENKTIKDEDSNLSRFLTSITENHFNYKDVPSFILNIKPYHDQYYEREEIFYKALNGLYTDFVKALHNKHNLGLKDDHATNGISADIINLCNKFAEDSAGTKNDTRYLLKLLNYLKAFSRVYYIEGDNSDMISRSQITSYYDILKVNRAELMGELLFVRELDPTEFERFFRKLKLDFLYHVVANCFPTVNLYIGDITEEELYPENDLFTPTKAVINYILKRNWLLALLLNEMYKMKYIDIGANVTRIQTFLNYMKLPRITQLKEVFEGNEIKTALQHKINSSKLHNFFNDKIKESDSAAFSASSDCLTEVADEALRKTKTNWKALYDVIENLPEIQLYKDTELVHLRDVILCNIVRDTFEDNHYEFVRLISDRELRIDTIVENCHKWPGMFCIRITKSEITRSVKCNDGWHSQMQLLLPFFEIYEEIKNIFGESSYYKTKLLAESDSGLVLEKLMETEKVDTLIKLITVDRTQKNKRITDDLLTRISYPYVLRLFTVKTPHDKIKTLLDLLPLDHSLTICNSLLKHLRVLEDFEFVINYIGANTNDESSLTHVKVSMKMLRILTVSDREPLFKLLNDPISIVEVLLMNTKFDKLGSVLNVLGNEVPHTGSDDLEVITMDRIDTLLRKYAEKSLDFRVITPVNPRLRKSPEIKLMQSIDSLNLVPSKSTFVMPENVPTKEEWTQNDSVLECMCCLKVAFSMFNRRHHCRRCGRIICHACSQRRMIVDTYGDILVRVCLDCYCQTYGSQDAHPSDRSTVDFEDGLSQRSLTYDDWLLTDDAAHNDIIREEFSYEHAPSVSLCLSILKYHTQNAEYAKFLLKQCENMLTILQQNQESVQEIDYFLVIKMLKSLAMAAKVSSSTCSLHAEASWADRILSQAELLTLLAERGCLSLLQIAGQRPSKVYIDTAVLRRLRDRLVEMEQWNLALEISLKAGLENFTVFASWGKNCLMAGSLTLAREKLHRSFEQLLRREQRPFDSSSQQFLQVPSPSPQTEEERYSKSSQTSLQRGEVKPTTDPPLLLEVIRLLEMKTQKIHQKALEEVKLIRSSGSTMNLCPAVYTDPAVTIYNKLYNIKRIVEGKLGHPSQSFELLKRPHENSSPPMQKIFYDECLYYLDRYGSHMGTVDFYLRHGEMDKAVRYILDNRLSSDAFIEIYFKCLKSGMVAQLQESLIRVDSRLELWKEYLKKLCAYLEKKHLLHSLYQLQQFMGDYIRAAISCVKLYEEGATSFTELKSRTNYLYKAEENFKHALEQEQWVEVSSVNTSSNDHDHFIEKAIINPSLVLKVEVKEIQNYIKTIKMEIEVVNFLANFEDGELNPMSYILHILPEEELQLPQKIPTMFNTTRERIYLAFLVIVSCPKVTDGFGLAKRIMETYRLKPIKVYCHAGHLFAKLENYTGLAEIVGCIRASGDTSDKTVSDMCDEILSLAVATLTKANVNDTRVEDLIKLITDKGMKISAYIEAKQLKTAYFLAVKYKNMLAIRKIMIESESLNQPSIRNMCQKVLNSHYATQGATTSDDLKQDVVSSEEQIPAVSGDDSPKL